MNFEQHYLHYPCHSYMIGRYDPSSLPFPYDCFVLDHDGNIHLWNCLVSAPVLPTLYHLKTFRAGPEKPVCKNVRISKQKGSLSRKIVSGCPSKEKQDEEFHFDKSKYLISAELSTSHGGHQTKWSF